MEGLAVMMKIGTLVESKNGVAILDIINMAVYFAPTDIRIGVFSPIISDTSELKAAISLLGQQSLVLCPKENTFIVPEDIGAKVRGFIDCIDGVGGFNVKEVIFKRAIQILKAARISDYPHSVSVYTHAKGNLEVLEELGDLPGVIVLGMMKDGKSREAVEFGKECDRYLTKILGENHRTVLNLECVLGLALKAIDKREDAIKLLSTAYDKSCRFGHDTEVQFAMQTLAKVICTDTISIDCAESRLRSIIFSGIGVSESYDLKKWVEYAKILLDLDLPVLKAILILDGVISRRTIISGPNDSLVFDAMELKALLLAASSNKFLEKEALKILRHIYAKNRKMLGPFNLKTLFAKGLIGEALLFMGNLDEAMTQFEDVVCNIEHIDSKSVNMYENEMTEMIKICLMREDFDKALQLTSDLHDKLVSVFGEIHPKCFEYRKQKSDIFLKLNQPEKALEILKRLLEDYKYELDEKELESFSIEIRRVENIHSFDASPGTLHSFAKDGNLEMVLSLIEAGKDIESKDFTGLTPLHYASAFGRVEVAKTLIGKGAKTPSKSPSGSTLLEVAKGSEMMNLLKNVRSFFEAVKSNDYDTIVGISLREPCVVGARDDQGCTPLHWAALRGYSGVFRLLLEFGSDPTAVSDKGNSPLHIAASKGHTMIAETLLRSLGPAEVATALDGRTGTGGNTPLHAAAEKGHSETVRSLLGHGAVCDAENAIGKTPLKVSECWGCRNLLGLVEGLFLDTINGDVAAVCAKLRDLESSDVLAVSRARNRDHRTLLQEAMKQKNLVLAKKLVKLLNYSS